MSEIVVVRELPALREAVRAWRARGERIALVPTMGALHAGHLTLVAEALRRVDHVVASVFVNPTQFGPGEDYAAYPRGEARDAGLLQEAGCELLWGPSVETMYPAGFSTTVTVGGVSEPLEGAARPGHFAGVATVVAKLLSQVQPDVAVFGEKDFQQLQVIRQMVADLDLPVEIAGAPTARDAHGLALSSRNAYLSEAEIPIARRLNLALRQMGQQARDGAIVSQLEALFTAGLLAAGFTGVDYITLRRPEDLQPFEGDRVAGPARALAAARLGRTRLIDNMSV